MAYRLAKTALNQQSMTLAQEFKDHGDNTTVLSLYPGYIPTKMTEYRGNVDMKEAVQGCVDVIEDATVEMSGQYLNYKGQQIPF